MPDFDLTGELSLKIELHMLRPITEKVHSGNGPVSLVRSTKVLLGYVVMYVKIHIWAKWNLGTPGESICFFFSFFFCKFIQILFQISWVSSTGTAS